MFVGRESELQFLENRYRSNKAELVVLYGRRRVGKTETLRQFCKDKQHVFFACRESSDQLQLENFSEKILKRGVPASAYINRFNDWGQAFENIAEMPFGDRKRLVVIDEFPYMCKGNSSIPSILQNVWDEKLKDQNVMIVLCGSSLSFIEKELLSEKNPLYGRATGILKMQELGFYDSARFFPDYSALDKVLAYSVVGGIPHYLKQFDPERTLDDNIKTNVLTRGCVLYSEVEFLLKQELRETALYNALIDAIALGNTKLNEIRQKALIDSSAKASVYLKNLKELGLVEREFSIDAKDKERSNAGRGIYKLTDNFFRFWYAFVFGNYSELENGDVEGVYEYEVKPNLEYFASPIFESVCKQFVELKQIRQELPFRYTKIGRWMGQTTVRDKDNKLRTTETEIDIMAISSAAEKYLIGECKFKKSPFDFGEYLDTVAKLSNEKQKAEFYYALFSRSGFEDNLIVEAKNNTHLTLFDIEEIVGIS